MNLVRGAFGVTFTAALAACSALAQPSNAPREAARPGASTPADDAATESRLLVKLVRPATDGAAIARLVAAASGLPTRYVTATSTQWHAVAVRCGAPPACAAALQRLRAATADFEAVEPDQMMRTQRP
jgi:hypothetical protein